jgi:hypothetical protein
MRVLLCAALLAVAVGCEVKPKGADTPASPSDMGVAYQLPFEDINGSKAANLPFAKLWSSGEPKLDTKKELAWLMTRQYYVMNEKACLAANVLGSAIAGPDGLLLSAVAVHVHPYAVAKLSDTFGFSMDGLPSTFPLFEIAFDSPEHIYTRRLLMKASTPPAQLPARVEAFAKLVEQEVNGTGARVIELVPVTEPRPGFRIRYETDTRTGLVTVAAAKVGETQAQLSASFAKPAQTNTFRYQAMGSVEDNSFVIVMLDELKK